MSIQTTLNQRGERYGSFESQATISQSLATVMRNTPNWGGLPPDAKEALEMIQHKVARILNGDPSYTDSWHDIAGYATLVEQRLNNAA